MILAGVREAIAEMNAQAFSLITKGDAEWLSDDVPSLLGRPARSFGEFAHDFELAFSKSYKSIDVQLEDQGKGVDQWRTYKVRRQLSQVRQVELVERQRSR